MNPETEYREGLEELAAHYKDILRLLGEDTEREGLEKTPMRVAKAMQVLTRIGYDHMAILGNTLTEIASEKAGILKENVPAIFAPQDDEALAVLQQHLGTLVGGTGGGRECVR